VRIGDSSDSLPAVAKGEHRKFVLSGEHRGICPVIVVPGAGDAVTEARFEFVKRYCK
jgi:hypothetical protein